MIKFLRTTVAGGILFLVPFVIIYAIVAKALAIARQLVRPIELYLPIDSFLGFDEPHGLALLLLVAVCSLVGIFARTSLARSTTGKLESSFLNRIPGYLFFKNVAEEIAIGSPTERFQSVLVKLDDAAQIGFLIENDAEKQLSVVFIPGAPNPTSGDVMIVASHRVVLLEQSTVKTVNCLQRLGTGYSALLGKHFSLLVS